jgi:hypothetical protein
MHYWLKPVYRVAKTVTIIKRVAQAPGAWNGIDSKNRPIIKHDRPRVQLRYRID